MDIKEFSKEKEFLEQYRPDDYERPSVSTDILIFTIDNVKNPRLKILLVKRGNHPFKGCWALPGGFVGMKESIDSAARSKLKEKTGLEGIYLEQLYTFGEPERDPRMRVISCAYMAMISGRTITVNAGEGADDIKWFGVEHRVSGEQRQLIISDDDSDVEMKYYVDITYEENGVVGNEKEHVSLQTGSESALAFDHAEIINMAINRIAGKCEYVPILFNLMPEVFTLPELQSVYELFLRKKLHKTLFRNKMQFFIDDTGESDSSTLRPAKLYKYRK